MTSLTPWDVYETFWPWHGVVKNGKFLLPDTVVVAQKDSKYYLPCGVECKYDSGEDRYYLDYPQPIGGDVFRQKAPWISTPSFTPEELTYHAANGFVMERDVSGGGKAYIGDILSGKDIRYRKNSQQKWKYYEPTTKKVWWIEISNVLSNVDAHTSIIYFSVYNNKGEVTVSDSITVTGVLEFTYLPYLLSTSSGMAVIDILHNGSKAIIAVPVQVKYTPSTTISCGVFGNPMLDWTPGAYVEVSVTIVDNVPTGLSWVILYDSNDIFGLTGRTEVDTPITPIDHNPPLPTDMISGVETHEIDITYTHILGVFYASGVVSTITIYTVLHTIEEQTFNLSKAISGVGDWDTSVDGPLPAEGSITTRSNNSADILISGGVWEVPVAVRSQSSISQQYYWVPVPGFPNTYSPMNDIYETPPELQYATVDGVSLHSGCALNIGGYLIPGLYGLFNSVTGLPTHHIVTFLIGSHSVACLLVKEGDFLSSEVQIKPGGSARLIAAGHPTQGELVGLAGEYTDSSGYPVNLKDVLRFQASQSPIDDTILANSEGATHPICYI